MIVILFCYVVVYTGTRIHIRYMRNGLVVVDLFIVKSESKQSPQTDFVAEDMKETIWTIFVYIVANFQTEWRENVRTFKILDTDRIFIPSLLSSLASIDNLNAAYRFWVSICVSVAYSWSLWCCATSVTLSRKWPPRISPIRLTCDSQLHASFAGSANQEVLKSGRSVAVTVLCDSVSRDAAMFVTCSNEMSRVSVNLILRKRCINIAWWFSMILTFCHRSLL